MDRFAARELGENQKEARGWERRVESVFAELLEFDPDEWLEEGEREGLDAETLSNQREVAYRVKTIRHELEVEELLVHGEGMDGGSEFEEVLRRGKERLMLEYL